VNLTDEQLDRYQRHIVLREIGGLGQKRFLQSRVAVIGAGGLGCPMLASLAAAGIGRLTIIDDDQVALSNLQRQTLFTTGDVGRWKAYAAAERLAAINPDVQIEVVTARITVANAEALLAGHDSIADGCDNFLTRAVVNAAAVKLGIPLVSAALGPFEGQLGVFAGHLPDTPCHACFAGAATDVPGTSCADVGVLGAVASVMGSAQAIEVLRLAAGFGGSRIGQLWLFDGLTMEARSVRVAKDPACPVCAR